jgi:hypothetical protein
MTDVHHSNEGFEPTREDVIIGRIVDGEASPSDWHDLDRIAERDQSVWQRLARAQRAHARLERAVEDEIAVAELVELPLRRHHAIFDFATRVRAYGGWAAAAVLALALLGSYSPLQRGLPGHTTLSAGYTPLHEATPDEAYDRYVRAGRDTGRVVYTLPSVLIEADGVGTPEGGDVLIVRRIVERMSAKDMAFFTLEPNEFSKPTLRPIEIRTPVRPETVPAGF